MTDEIELKPCPFCGGKAHYYYQRENECIVCEECGAKLTYFDFGEDAQEELTKQWNTRPIEDVLKEENKRLREVLERIEEQAELEESEASNATYGFAYDIEQLAREALKGKEDE